MDKIIKLNRRHIEQLLLVDFESEHKNSSKHVNKKEMKKGIENRFDKCHEIFFGYKKNNELVGYVTLKPFFPGYKHCEVYWLAVKKKCQGQGVGSKLMVFIEKYAKKNGFRKVCVYTAENMRLTRKFYEKLGYKLINEFKGYYGYTSGNTTAVLYAKSL
jgi:ribosomal protein S18 acetylase RimI-like enzyme